jgi:hypothetical protein
MICEHEWEEVESEKINRIYNANGEYVEGVGWEEIFVPIQTLKKYRCNKCNSLKKGEVIFPPLPKPKVAFRMTADGSSSEEI